MPLAMSDVASGGAVAVDVTERDSTTPSAAPSIRPGGIAAFYAWVDRLPVHGWWLYPAMAVALLAWASVILWVTGRLPLGTFDPTLTVSVAYGPYALGILAYVNRTADQALETFWPATGWPERDRPAWSHAFATVRAGLGLPSLVFGIVVAIAAFLAAPTAVVGAETQERLIYAVALAPSAVFGYAMTAVVIAHTFRQLRLVVTIHRRAEALDPFDRRPVYAFSRFTALIGLAFLASGYYTLTVNSAFQSGNLVGLGVLASIIALGTACFVLPLWGIHDRLVDEKETLLTGVEERVRSLADELYRRIDAGEFDGTKVINEAIAAAGAYEARIERLPTWPWPPQLFRGFLSALLLPVLVYLLTRLAGGLIGA